MLIPSMRVTHLYSLLGSQPGNLVRAMFWFAVQRCHADQMEVPEATGQPRSAFHPNLAMCRVIWLQAAGLRSGSATGVDIAANDT
jgi:hypothetical protein